MLPDAADVTRTASDDDDEDDDGYVDEDWQSPRCRRKKVDFVPLNPVWVILALPLLGEPLLWVPRQKRCRECGHVSTRTN